GARRRKLTARDGSRVRGTARAALAPFKPQRRRKQMMKTYVFAAALALSACGQAAEAPTPAPTAAQDASETRPFPDDAPRVYFAKLSDSDTVRSPFRVVFGVSGMGVAPAGVERPNTGHHHLLVDATLSAEERAYAIPASDNHLHFGGGQTETVL